MITNLVASKEFIWIRTHKHTPLYTVAILNTHGYKGFVLASWRVCVFTGSTAINISCSTAIGRTEYPQ